MAKKKELTRFSLSVEELALLLGLLEQPTLGRGLLAPIYPEADQPELEALLTSASHALLARGYCAMTVSGAVRMDPALEAAVRPLVQSDDLLNFNLTTEASQVSAVIHIRHGKSFTAHLGKGGVVQVLQHGSIGQLPDYLEEILEDFGEAQPSRLFSFKLTLGLLMEALQDPHHPGLLQVLEKHGLTGAAARDLANDLAHQLMQCSIVKIQDADTAEAFGQMLILVQGQKYSWMMQFAGLDEQAAGSAKTLSKAGLRQVIQDFIATS